MSTATPSVAGIARRAAAPDPARWLYSVAGIVLLCAMLVGFQQFFFHGRAYPDREIPPPIRTLVIVHGLATASWVVLFTVQPVLIATRRYRAHMALGRIGVGIAAALLVLGTIIAVQSARVTSPEARIWTLPPRHFMAVPLATIYLYGAMVAVAVWYRRRPPVHRAMMFTATLCISGAAVSRIDPINNLYTGTAWERFFGPFLGIIVLGLVFLALRCTLTRSFDRSLATGVTILLVVSGLTMAVARTGPWDSLASVLVP